MKEFDFEKFEKELAERLESTNWDQQISHKVIRRKKHQRVLVITSSFTMLLIVFAAFSALINSKPAKMLNQVAVTFDQKEISEMVAVKIPDSPKEVIVHLDFVEDGGSDDDIDDFINDTLALR